MINPELLLKIYAPATMQRWNDQIRTVEFTELDKQAHKMVIAYVLAKCEEDCQTGGLDWIEIIEAGIFEYLQRATLTDLKPPLFHMIKENRQKYLELNEWVYKKTEPLISFLGENFCLRFKNYLIDTQRNLNRQIISAAHFYATRWEFDIIERDNPAGYGIGEIKKDILNKQERYQSLKGMREFLFSQKLKYFVNICGQLRFQIRWSHIPRIPKTSVLGHMLIVAIFSYLFSLSAKRDKLKCRNNYFTGLFHDLPEILTRDIINPVKTSVEGLKDLIKEYERQEMERKIYKLIHESWHSEMKMFTEDEFKNTPLRDGELVKAMDDLAAFLEAYLALNNGIRNADLEYAKKSLKEKYKSQDILGTGLGEIFAVFA